MNQQTKTITLDLEHPTVQQVFDMVCKEKRYEQDSEVGRNVLKNIKNHIELYSVLSVKYDEVINVLQETISLRMKEDKHYFTKNETTGVFEIYQSKKHFKNGLCPSVIFCEMNEEVKRIYTQLDNSENYVYVGFSFKKGTRGLCLIYKKNTGNLVLSGFMTPSS